MDNNTPLGDSELQTLTLESNSSAVNYHAWLCEMAVPYLGDAPLELGSGLGDYAQTWLDGGLEQITISEVEPRRHQMLQERFGDDPRVRLVSVDLTAEQPGTFSSVVSFNVMEHVPDDRRAFRSAYSLLRSGGYLVTFAPAFPFAMSQFDRAVGHVRRYRLDGIRNDYRSAGFEIVESRYYNAPGLLAWFVGMKLMRMTPKAGTTLSFWDGQVVPRVRAWESQHTMPFGQSVLVVGRKP